ncbi:DUF4012 domain-containing protein [Arthrobacter sp. NPDC056493]|uniref:DUF4012 domain-containing protein n=1 Tax=Arthrobacter sp. NPDC056493 TaxID=3345839 RepID=UPI00366C5D6E
MTEPSTTDVRRDDAYLASSRTPRRKKPSRLKTLIWLAVALGLLALAVVWLGTRASTISNHLEAASKLAPVLKQNIVQRDPEAAAKSAGELNEHTAQARQAAADPLWTLAGALPFIGQNFQAVSTIATAADEVAKQGVAPVVSTLKSLDWEELTPNEQGVNLAPLKAAEPKLTAAAYVVSQTAERLSELDTSALLPQISQPLVQAREQLGLLEDGLVAASDAAKVAPSMMGASQKRYYLLLIQNNAESRATGGIPGALAVLEVEKGKLALVKQTSATELGTMSPVVPIDPEQQLIYSARVGKFMQDVNLTPDFPTSAKTAVAMWEQKYGERLDGAISIDPVALSYLLTATGPVQLDPELQRLIGPGLPTKLTGGNVVKTLLSDVYSQIPDPKLQDVYFAAVAKELFGSLSAGNGDAAKLIAGVARGGEEGRIMVWSANEAEQSVITKYAVGRSISGPSTSPAQFGVYFNDGTGAKMDYHVKRTVQLVEECPADGYVQIKVRVTSTNTAPKDAATVLPEYVTGGGAFGIPAGSVQTNIVAYGPVQSNVQTAFVAGKKTPFSSQRHVGRPVGTVTVRLAPGQSTTVEFTFGKIVQHTEPVLAVTPTVQAIKDVVRKTETATCAPAS